jgi:hypothetical protein
VQGLEAKAIMSIVNLHAETIVLLQHAGFTARKRLDCEALEQVVFDKVGYRLKVEERQLELHEDARQLMCRTKVKCFRRPRQTLVSTQSVRIKG